ncbi:MAG: molybdopterin-dependent oxidoreductase [Gammaproteobacteria bacterium]|jgi:isoquinoline 1-oxidoreductase beta subunit|nr:molybdopterin-dependent oxidoreductase [Gammaproteobacteria bacterium]
MKMTRRSFLQVSGLAGGGFLLGFQLTAAEARTAPVADDEFAPNAWVRIDPDGRITAVVASSEMGQGVMTAIPMLLAEELEADWQSIHAEFAPADTAYTNPIIGQQLTGGSTAVRGYWTPVREAGAAARMMLLAAAAQRWGVAENACTARNSEVIHAASGRRLGYGELASEAAKQPVPAAVFLKEPGEFALLGTPQKRLDTPQKCDGSALFAQDVTRPNMLTAVVQRCPVFGGTRKGFDAESARQVKGVVDVLPLDDDAVAVVAEGWWPAQQARDKLRIDWDFAGNGGLSSADITAQFEQAVDAGISARSEGDVAAALDKASTTLEATYEVPYLAHACMEPMTCVAEIGENGCDVWVGTQAQTRTQQTAMAITGLPQEQVRVHTLFLGGGFGRRSEQDFVRDAVSLAKQTGRPVKVIWSREDDIQHDYYRPATFNRLAAALDADGRPVAWRHRIAGPSIRARNSEQVRESGMDGSSVEGAENLPYRIENLDVTYAMVNPPVPVGYWRSVGSSQNAFITEAFFDEVARAAGRDPYELRLELLADQPRHRGVLELAATKAGWGEPLPAGRARGIAVAKSFGSYCAQVAEVELDEKRVRVKRVVCALDCGQIVNPAIIEAQMESGIAYGLNATLNGEITIGNGRVQQGNFDDYPLLGIAEMPEVEVHIVDSDASPGGVGEPGTPPIAPAVANAVFALTGKPVRRLPIRLG